MNKNCPYCGNQPPHAVKTFRFKWWLSCMNCGASGPVADSRKGAELKYQVRIPYG